MSQASEKDTFAEAEEKSQDTKAKVPSEGEEDDDELIKALIKAQNNKGRMPPSAEHLDLQCGFAFDQLDATGQFDESTKTPNISSGYEVGKEKQQFIDAEEGDDDQLIKALIKTENKGQQCGFAFDQLDAAGQFHNESLANSSKEVQQAKIRSKQELEPQPTGLKLECGLVFDMLDHAGAFGDSTKSSETRRAATITSTCRKTPTKATGSHEQNVPVKNQPEEQSDYILDPDKNSNGPVVSYGLPANATSPAWGPRPAAMGETSSSRRPPPALAPGAYLAEAHGMRRISKIDYSLVGTHRESSPDEASFDGSSLSFSANGDHHQEEDPVARPVMEDERRDLEDAKRVTQEELTSSNTLSLIHI